MIRVTLELIPGGVGEPELLGTIDIDNRIGRTMATGGKRGDYNYELCKKRKGHVVSKGHIDNFPRLSYHPWNLVKRILDDVARKNMGQI